ncbi:hypothetical protein A6279_02890 [Bacillus wiedmannii]|uniref:DUF4440 domain-containing protein n=2 Tax=Bacillus cereus group TaxID=86661 RepID=A0A1G6T212_9BACI|nr:hypothetical protein [Bacillus wiedmannii]EJQ55607.1 hypothetical protein IEI_00870 [Bacillus wiedmannii]KMP30277.1 hypothetical protein TU50_01940 [Bacillus wiedmannii]MCT6916408.1 hypothetical protein [Bacillus wiedmannii]MED2837233.1 hypothetical protein [Bacillus wiedmannii]OAK10546.1 hypothetical protein A6278_02150 [Bacillus wiedmannii]
MKRICTFFIMIGSFFCFNQFADAATPLQVVQKELQHISNKQPVLYSKLWIRSMQNAILFHHSDNLRHEDTISNVTKSSLIKVKQLPLQKASQYIPRLSQYISKFEAENVQVYYVSARYEVKKENPYQLNGMNYFMQVFIQQGGEWRIAESIVAPTDQIVANGDGFGTKQEKEYGKRRENVK